MLRHGGRWIAPFAVLAPAVAGQVALPVRSRVVDVRYEINEQAQPLTSVELWASADRGQTWQLHGYDEDRQPPVAFEAPTEGLWALFVLAENSSGPSSQRPTSNTPPHAWVFVDFTPPVIQLHPLRATTLIGQRVVQVRWTAIDAHLSARPIELEYQSVEAAAWTPMCVEPLANTGRFDWRIPDGLRGAVSIRATVTDRGGHRVGSTSQVVEIGTAVAEPVDDAVPPGVERRPGGAGDSFQSAPASPRVPGAVRLVAEAQAFGEMGDFRRSVARLREAVRLDPQHAEAFAELGRMLYLLGDLDRAQDAYTIALNQQPRMRAALKGAAMVDRQRHDYASATKRLRTILRNHPDDAETWMHLGDIGIFQGDELLAKECYLRATRIDPAATQTIEEAQRRLALMEQVSRAYEPAGRP